MGSFHQRKMICKELSSFQSPDIFRVLLRPFSVMTNGLHSLPFYFYPILTQWITIILSKECKPDNFESHNSLKLSFTNIWGLHSNFVDCEFFPEWNEKTQQILMFLNVLYFTQCLSSFSSIDHLLHLFVWCLILFHLT